MEQSPCPDRIVDDFGSAFLMGAVGSAFVHGYKGIRDSPKGFKIQGSLQTIALRAPHTGGSFAMWGGLFSTFDCGLAYARGGKQDHYNSVLAGGFTGGILAFRGGSKAMGKNFIIGAALLGVIELFGVGITSLTEKFMPNGQSKLPESVKKTMLTTDIKKSVGYVQPPAYTKLVDVDYTIKEEDLYTPPPQEQSFLSKFF